ncbi:MAG TPA: TetR/AcrR family transcriptional regulator [Nocardioides sp.]|nr:TetR/AcrR family transcriptional regulator [Nocardioides sp.]
MLLEAAERIVIRKGAGATALEIAHEAGVHRSVLYRHFVSADELIRDAALRPFRDFLDSFETLTRVESDRPASLWTLLVGFVDQLLSSLEPHREFLIAIANDRDLFGGDRYGEFRSRLDAVLEQLTAASAAEGAIRGIDMTPMPTRVRFVVAMAAGLVTYGDLLLPRGSAALGHEELVTQLAEFILYGVKASNAERAEEDHRPPPPSGTVSG